MIPSSLSLIVGHSLQSTLFAGLAVETVLNRQTMRLSGGKKTLFANARMFFLALPVIIGALSALPVYAQSQPSQRFDAASIKPHLIDYGFGGFRPSGGRLTAANVTLLDLVLFAYQVKDFQVSGGPGWMNATRYDIEANGPGGSTLDQKRTMMQALLRERFALSLHREIKELPIFELVVAKGGVRMRPTNCIAPESNQSRAPEKKPSQNCSYMALGRGTMDATSANMSQIAGALSILTGRTVVDKTGLEGTFGVELRFLPNETTRQILGPPDPANPSPVVDGVDISTAVQEQLGLRLESKKGPVEVLVIDHVETPSAN